MLDRASSPEAMAGIAIAYFYPHSDGHQRDHRAIDTGFSLVRRAARSAIMMAIAATGVAGGGS